MAINQFPIQTKNVNDTTSPSALNGTEKFLMLKGGVLYSVEFTKVAAQMPSGGSGNEEIVAEEISRAALTTLKTNAALEPWKGYKIIENNVVVIASSTSTFLIQAQPAGDSYNTTGLAALLGTTRKMIMANLIATGDAYLKTNEKGEIVRSTAAPVEKDNRGYGVMSGIQLDGFDISNVNSDILGWAISQVAYFMFMAKNGKTVFSADQNAAAARISAGEAFRLLVDGKLITQSLKIEGLQDGPLYVSNGQVIVGTSGGGGGGTPTPVYNSTYRRFNLAKTNAASTPNAEWTNVIGDPISSNPGVDDADVYLVFQYFFSSSGNAADDNLNAEVARAFQDGNGIPAIVARSGFFNFNPDYGNFILQPKNHASGRIYDLEFYGASSNAGLDQANVMTIKITHNSGVASKTISTYNQTGTLKFENLIPKADDNNYFRIQITGTQYGIINGFRLTVKTPV